MSSNSHESYVDLFKNVMALYDFVHDCMIDLYLNIRIIIFKSCITQGIDRFVYVQTEIALSKKFVMSLPISLKHPLLCALFSLS